MVRSIGWVARGPVCRAALSIALLVSLALTLGGCEKEPTQPPPTPARNFRLAMVPFPAEASTPSFTEAIDFVGEHADVVVHHFDDGVPWETSVLGQDPPLEVRDEFAYRRYRAAQLGMPVHVTITWLNTTRDSIAAGRGGSARPPSIASDATFANPEVRRALKFWSAWVATYFEPEAFSPGIEINLYERSQPSDWPNLLSLYHEVADTLRLLNTRLKIFPTWQLDDLHERNRFNLLFPVAPQLDVVALSLYPGGYPLAGPKYTPATLPADYFARVRSSIGSSQPIWVAETGYGDSALAALGTPGSPQLQRDYIAWLVQHRGGIHPTAHLVLPRRRVGRDRVGAAGVAGVARLLWPDGSAEARPDPQTGARCVGRAAGAALHRNAPTLT
jgi:hypothetical protein